MLAKSKDADLIWEAYTQPEADDLVTEGLAQGVTMDAIYSTIGPDFAESVKGHIANGTPLSPEFIAHLKKIEGSPMGGTVVNAISQQIGAARAHVKALQDSGHAPQAVKGAFDQVWQGIKNLPLWAKLATGAAAGVGGYYAGKGAGLWGDDRDDQPLRANYSPLNTTAPGIS